MRFGLVNFVYEPRGRGGAIGWVRGFDLFGRRWAFDRSLVLVDGEKYLDRWIVYLNGYTLRLHKFYRGDDDRASHSHPWPFVTFPLASYIEWVHAQGRPRQLRVVEAWRPHFRPATFEHFVVGRAAGHKPFYTIVITGPKRDTWGFYPEPDKFISWKDYD
jgi:hypothetical protein